MLETSMKKLIIKSIAFTLRLLSLLGLLATNACASDDDASAQAQDSSFVNQDRIFTTYKFEYDGNADSTVVSAQFWFGEVKGTPLRLDTPALIAFNDERLGYDEDSHAYQKQIPGFVDQGAFQYTNNDNRVFDNTLNPIGTTCVPDNTLELDRNRDYYLGWGNGALVDGESVEITLEAQNGTKKTFTQDAKDASSVALDNQALDDLPAGIASIKATRKRTSAPTQATTVGGQLEIIYHQKSVHLTLK